ncbi:MAG: hypothetical protein A3I88_00755 [Candidatus Portnoybacteria bacterium RIFCSPLOWO2_12_FULL_39_9]|uniref:Uncharacterized protein n=1 Tax=Candidatus Portnoybacteria bacterium RIFCSPHIGHO2_12_FULL_38_9 TaxID=1801997 RepID=A0A1G2FFH1_9BACT|nr:MAG: hypothetical protein A3H00_02565 [Candidatus Portnoybacteria bacterium RBG_13_40_8]OGZ35638.1 MAG: hypothetical protein A2646_01175 [Candidatus Portnoybacteria bacterium RIFCSPHIGHO2_02_FULL_39_12]OGZ36291.1 MAG: hypothetical protein A3J64_03005 [Candidatus Portnoybacteria bacterium RIFCSPHIGHO2_12_FULL_38_9]OGZ38770.1 MAG: hypothetical protein A3F21_03410 [Candidatus Portnoybacteria bacterium RIFCSPLOWO2_01_FULL_38_39]OGZ40755.1 MAG: hypothetical protein A3I88_00755 [Candidatus Portnoy
MAAVKGSLASYAAPLAPYSFHLLFTNNAKLGRGAQFCSEILFIQQSFTPKFRQNWHGKN